jgi:integration host factor subunit alpha
MTLTKADLSETLFNKVGLNKTEAKEMVEAFFEEIKASLESGDSVKLSGFGNFDLRTKAERPGRNPKTGKEIPIKARRVVTFHSSQKLKTSVEEKSPGKQT